MNIIPDYHPPSDYRRPTKTQEKVYVPVNDYPEINFSKLTICFGSYTKLVALLLFRGISLNHFGLHGHLRTFTNRSVSFKRVS